jgi:hypothetical protein
MLPLLHCLLGYAEQGGERRAPARAQDRNLETIVRNRLHIPETITDDCFSGKIVLTLPPVKAILTGSTLTQKG